MRNIIIALDGVIPSQLCRQTHIQHCTTRILQRYAMLSLPQCLHSRSTNKWVSLVCMPPRRTNYCGAPVAQYYFIVNIYGRRDNEHDKMSMCVRCARLKALALVTQMCPSPSCQPQLYCYFRQKDRWTRTDWQSRERFNQKHLAYRVWETNHRHHNWIPLCNHFSS